MASPIAERAARKLLGNITKLPVSLDSLCRKLNVKLRFERLGRINAFFLSNDGYKLIVVNDDHSLLRQRFSIAHELAHVYLQHAALSFSSELINDQPRWPEFQANAFAAELLMPKKILVRHGYLAVQQICELCLVSTKAATIRSEQLGWTQRELGL